MVPLGPEQFKFSYFLRKLKDFAKIQSKRRLPKFVSLLIKMFWKEERFSYILSQKLYVKGFTIQ